MKIEKFEDLEAQFSQYGLVVSPQFRTNVLSQTLNGSIINVVDKKGDRKVYVGIKYPESFVLKLENMHSYKIIGKLDSNLELICFG